MAKFFRDVETVYGGGIRFNKGFILKITSNAVSSDIEGLIVQNLSVGGQRPVTTVYDLVSEKAYHVAGKSSASAGLNRIVGSRGIVGAFYDVLGDVCNNNLASFTLPEQCLTESANRQATDYNTIYVKQAVLVSVEFSCNAQNYMISENCQIMGVELEQDYVNIQST